MTYNHKCVECAIKLKMSLLCSFHIVYQPIFSKNISDIDNLIKMFVVMWKHNVQYITIN